MSESKVIPLPDGDDEGADETISIDLDTLSDDQLDALSDEAIQRLPEIDRHKIACRLLVARELLPPGNPERKTFGWIARRVGLGDRQFHRLRNSDSWPRLMEDEHHRARTFMDDLPLSRPRERMKALQELFDNEKTRPSDRVRIIKEFDRVDKERGNTAVDRERQGARGRMREKMLQVISRLPSGPPTDPQPGGIRRPASPTTDEPS